MSQTLTSDRLNRIGGTLRPDAWWIEIAPTIVVFSAFVIYTTWREVAVPFTARRYYGGGVKPPDVERFWGAPSLMSHSDWNVGW
jgi:hypothetical protein